MAERQRIAYRSGLNRVPLKCMVLEERRADVNRMSDALGLSQNQAMEQLLAQLEIDVESGTVSARGVVLLQRADDIDEGALIDRRGLRAS